MRHFSFTKTLEVMAESGWGTNCETQDQASRELLSAPDKMAAIALLELVRRFNRFIESMSDRNRPRNDALTKPCNAKAFPDKSVGDFVYHGDLDEGIGRQLVIAKDAEGFVLVVCCDYFSLEYTPTARFACDFDYGSLQETVADAAKKDIEYHAPRLKHSQEALAAVENGGDLARFAEGFPDK